jgi:hypothetical protein
MLILLASEGSALHKAADDRMTLRRERIAPASPQVGFQGTGGTEASGEARERGRDSESGARLAQATWPGSAPALEEWRMWAAPPPLGAAPRAP